MHFILKYVNMFSLRIEFFSSNKCVIDNCLIFMYYSSIISIIYDVDGFCCQNWKIIINDPSTAPLGRECMFVCGLVSLSELKIGIQKIA